MSIVPLDSLGQKRPGVPAVTEAVVEDTIDREVEQAALAVKDSVRERAYRLFLQGLTAVDIVTALKIPTVTQETVLVWAQNGHWYDNMKRRNDTLEKITQENVRSMRLSRAYEEAESALALSKRIRDRAAELLEKKNLSPQELKFIGDASKCSSDIGAHGMGRASGEDAGIGGLGGQQQQPGKQPLVIVFQGGGLPPMNPGAQGPIINVEGGENGNG